jgi:hypothetical protein
MRRFDMQLSELTQGDVEFYNWVVPHGFYSNGVRVLVNVAAYLKKDGVSCTCCSTLGERVAADIPLRMSTTKHLSSILSQTPQMIAWRIS